MTIPEPEPERLPEATINRNWTELIQELRSTQTGVQVLTGFLLAVPFTDRFHTLDHVERTAYLFVLTGAVSASIAVLAPIAYHRILFRRDRRPWLVETANRIARAGLVLAALTMCGVVFLATANRIARAGLVLAALTMCGVVFLAFDLTAGRGAGIVASVVAFVAYVGLWVVVPLRAHPPSGWR